MEHHLGKPGDLVSISELQVFASFPGAPWDSECRYLPSVAPASLTNSPAALWGSKQGLVPCCFFLSLSDHRMRTLKIKVHYAFVLLDALWGKADKKILVVGNSLGCSLHLKVVDGLSLDALLHASFLNLPSYVWIIFHAMLNKAVFISFNPLASMNFGCFLAAFIILLQFSLCNMLSSLQFVELLPKMGEAHFITCYFV